MISEGPKYGIAMKLSTDLSPTRFNPGPGTYELLNRDNLNFKKNASWKIGSEERLPKEKNSTVIVPGPGNY